MNIRLSRHNTTGIVLFACLFVGITIGGGCNQKNNLADKHGDKHGDDQGEHNVEKRAIHISDKTMAEFDIQLATAGPGTLIIQKSLPGELVFNPDRVAHVVPRVPGVVREVRKTVGDRVVQGELLAILDSRELASAKAKYLSALARLDVAQANYDRQKPLFEKRIKTEADFLVAKQTLAESRVSLRLAKRNLHPLGLREKDIAALPKQTDSEFNRYDLISPIAGEIVDRHLTRGEVVMSDPKDPPFVVADLSTVWVHLTVYQKDLTVIRPGQPVTIQTGHGMLSADGIIDYISPSVREKTRTATARVVLDNPKGEWRPGLFVTGRVTTANIDVAIVVPKTAVQTLEDGDEVIFLRGADGFVPRKVRLGRSNGSHVEILSGLEKGQEYVERGGFVLKAEMNKASFEHAGHGH